MAHPTTQPAIPKLGNATPHQRGSADSYYRRLAISSPHKMVNYKKVFDLTEEEVAEYWAGVEENENRGDFKEYE